MDRTSLLRRVNNITKRNETSAAFDLLLLDVLIDLSAKTRYLKASEAGTTTADQNYLSKPSDMAGNEIDGLIINSIKYNPISWDDFLGDKKDGYCVIGNKIYIHPTPSSAYTYTLYYSRIHPSSLTTILFPDVFKSAVEHGCAAKVYETYEINDQMSIQLTLFENEIQKYSGYGQSPQVAKPYIGI